MDPEPEPGLVLDLPDGFREPQRQLPAVGVAEHEDVGARVSRGVEDPQRGFGGMRVAVEEVFGVEEDPCGLLS